MVDFENKKLQYQTSIRKSTHLLNTSLGNVANAIATGTFGRMNLKKRIERVREETDKKKRTVEKQELPYILVSGITKDSTREADLIEHTGLYPIDIDHDDNPILLKDNQSLLYLKNILEEDTKLILLAVSPSGNGLKGLVYVPESTLENHREVFSALSNYFFDNYEITIDPSGKNPNRLMFLTYDPHVQFNDGADPFSNYQDYLMSKDAVEGENNDVKIDDHQIIDCLKQIDSRKIDISKSYDRWFRLGFFSANYGEEGRELFHKISAYYNGYSREDTDKQFDACLKCNSGKITAGTFFKYCKENGIEATKQRKQNQYSSELKITEFLKESPTFPDFVFDNFPQPIVSKICNLLSSKRERDIFLLSFISVSSSLMNRVYGNYDASIVRANLYSIILAPPASDKGVAKHVMKCLEDIVDYQESLFKGAVMEWEENDGSGEVPVKRTVLFPGNSTSPALLQMLRDNPHGGIMIETEADVVGSMFKMDHGDYSNLLRKAAHHEMISSARKTKNEFITVKNPYLSVLLTGTPNQLYSIVDNTEDGLFSRFIYYVYSTESKFRNPFRPQNQRIVEELKELTEFTYELWSEWQSSKDEIEFVWTHEQQKQMFEFFDEWLKSAQEIIRDDVNSVIKRYGLIFFRICMVLSVLRKPINVKKIICQDLDFKVAFEIIKVIRVHSMKVIELMPKTEEIKPIEGNKEALYNQLPNNFKKGEAIRLAEKMAISSRSVHRYCNKWVTDGYLEKNGDTFYKRTN